MRWSEQDLNHPRVRRISRECAFLKASRFLTPEVRKAFFEAYKDIETLWEILSPAPELRDYIETYKHLSQLYAAVRNAETFKTTG